jgi:uncharacterized protein YjbJ (UPF0337 family)
MNVRKWMDWDQIGAKWQQFKGWMKQEWGNLTDDDLDYVAGTRDRLVARLQEKYGVTKEEAELQQTGGLRPKRTPPLDRNAQKLFPGNGSSYAG